MYTGGFGSIIYEGKTIPGVKKYIWKLVADVEPDGTVNAAIVFVLHNDPHSEDVRNLCLSACYETNWSFYNELIHLGTSYCCNVRDFIHNVTGSKAEADDIFFDMEDMIPNYKENRFLLLNRKGEETSNNIDTDVRPSDKVIHAESSNVMGTDAGPSNNKSTYTESSYDIDPDANQTDHTGITIS